MKTSAAVLHKMYLERPYTTSRPLRIEEVELDTPGFNEVVVKIKAAGLCHSDLSVINGNRPRPLPMVLGHEAAGVVIELGDGVKSFFFCVLVFFSFLPSCFFCSSFLSFLSSFFEPVSFSYLYVTLFFFHKLIHNNN